MPPKKNVKKPKPKTKAKPKPKTKQTPTSTTNVDNRKISNKPQTQSVNVNVSVGSKSTESKSREPREPRESSSSKKSTEQMRTFAPTIVPQYVYGNPPPPPPQPPNRVVQPIYNPIRPNPIMTSLQSLDQPTAVSSLTQGTFRTGTLDDSISNLSDFSSRSVRSQPSYVISEPSTESSGYAISGPLTELSEESYNYSEPSGMNLQSVSSLDSGMIVPMPRTNFTYRPFDTSQLDSFDEVAQLVRESISKSLQERIARPRSPIREIIFDDGSIRVISGGQQQLTLEMGMADEPAPPDMNEEEFKQMSVAERVQEIENRKRGRKAGQKNRPKEEIEAEKAERDARKKAREEKMRQRIEEEQRKAEARERRSDFFANRQDEIDRRLLGEEENRFDVVERGVSQRQRLKEKMLDL